MSELLSYENIKEEKNWERKHTEITWRCFVSAHTIKKERKKMHFCVVSLLRVFWRKRERSWGNEKPARGDEMHKSNKTWTPEICECMWCCWYFYKQRRKTIIKCETFMNLKNLRKFSSAGSLEMELMNNWKLIY